MIQVVCVCKRRFEVQDAHAGLSIKCPGCRRLVEVPNSASDPLVEPEPPTENHEPPPPRVLPSNASSSEMATQHDALDQLVANSHAIKTRLTWIVALLALILVRLLMS